MKKPLCLAILAVALVGCKSANIKSFQTGDELVASTEGEKRLWYQSEKFDTALEKSNQIPELPELTQYLQTIMDKLFPEFKGEMTVNLHKAPVLNAFALPNGSIYINMGMLVSLENEAQIATVLAHEGIHFLQKHSAKQRLHRHSSQGMALAVSMLGVPLLGQLAAAGAISGYSVEHETESDNLGYERLVKAGYAASESPRAFEILAREAKANDRDEPFFFCQPSKIAGSNQ
jgi:predicted Zn-dependent protease